MDLPAGAAPVGATSDDVAVCVDTLLDNVFTHAPEGTPMSVELTDTASAGARLTVADSRPGFSDAVAAAERGVGTRPHSTGPCLDIARRVATGSGGTLVLGASPSGGAAVIVEFGAARDDADPARRQSRRALRRPRRP